MGTYTWLFSPVYVLMFGCLLVSNSMAQGIAHTCLPDSNAGDALVLRIDSAGKYHMLRGAFATGDILYTVVRPSDPTGNGIQTQTVEPLANFFPAQLLGADLLLRDEQPTACYFTRGRLRIATRIGNEWQKIDVIGGPELGDYCRLFEQGGDVGILFQHAGVLKEGIQMPNGVWSFEVVDDVGQTGANLDLHQFDDDHLVAVYQEENVGRTRVAWRLPDVGWQTMEMAPEVAARSGVSLRIVGLGAGDVFVVSGFEGTREGQRVVADAGFMIGIGAPGDLTTYQFPEPFLGGSVGAARLSGNRVGVAMRELRQNALVPRQFGLRLYLSLPDEVDFEYLALHEAGRQKHVYTNIDMAADPFGLPVIAVREERAPFNGLPGGVPVCLWHPSDRDGDRLPDVVELQLESDPDTPDTDGDGRTDGDAVFGGLHPVTGAPLPDDMFRADLDEADLEPEENMQGLGGERALEPEPSAGIREDGGQVAGHQLDDQSGGADSTTERTGGRDESGFAGMVGGVISELIAGVEGLDDGASGEWAAGAVSVSPMGGREEIAGIFAQGDDGGRLAAGLSADFAEDMPVGGELQTSNQTTLAGSNETIRNSPGSSTDDSATGCAGCSLHSQSSAVRVFEWVCLILVAGCRRRRRAANP